MRTPCWFSAGSIRQYTSWLLAMLGCSKSAEEVNQVNNLATLYWYTIQSMCIVYHPSIPRSEMDETIFAAYKNDKVEKEIPVPSKAMVRRWQRRRW